MKTLHTAYRVTNLAASLGFYSELGYREVGRVGTGDGASLTMLKFPGEQFVTPGHPDGISAADFA
jgi:lactoylglutathione lyase